MVLDGLDAETAGRAMRAALAAVTDPAARLASFGLKALQQPEQGSLGFLVQVGDEGGRVGRKRGWCVGIETPPPGATATNSYSPASSTRSRMFW